MQSYWQVLKEWSREWLFDSLLILGRNFYHPGFRLPCRLDRTGGSGDGIA